LLRPEYDHRSLQWLLEMAAQKNRPAALRKVVVHGAGQETLGWYLYYVNPGKASEVLQIVAKDTSVPEILDHLFYDARLQGTVALSGRLDPRFMRDLSERHCLFHFGGSWMLVHSRNSELLQAIHRGDAFLTRLEGEWWIGFQES